MAKTVYYAQAECFTCNETILQRVEETEKAGVSLTCYFCGCSRPAYLFDFARIVNTIGQPQKGEQKKTGVPAGSEV